MTEIEHLKAELADLKEKHKQHFEAITLLRQLLDVMESRIANLEDWMRRRDAAGTLPAAPRT